MQPHPLALLALLVLAGTGCQHGSSSGPSNTPLVVAAGMADIAPTDAGPGHAANLQRLGITRVDSYYRMTTPAGEEFSFDVLTQTRGIAGPARVSVAHVEDGAKPANRPGSLAEVGFVPAATGTIHRFPWLDAHGDGFARMSLGGAISRSQLLAFETETQAGTSVALIEIAIGPISRINRAGQTGGNHPDIVDETTLYSSDSWVFGLPTIAVSGDRTSIIAYEGDRASPSSGRRYEMRMQHDRATGKVTGGGSDETNTDSGHWRDHEIAALFNVLAVAHCGTVEVTLRLSFDRGATFAQEVTMGRGSQSTRLVQIAMAADYSLAVVFWRSTGAGTSTELILVEGRPATLDAGGSPTSFAFDPPRALFQAASNVTPLLTGAAWSEGGDLVIGHAFTEFRRAPTNAWTSRTQFWCAVRRFQGKFVEQLIDEDLMVGKDPSVALLGSGAKLRIFYAYEGLRGLRLRVSDNAGATFSAPVWIGMPGAHTPTVFARPGPEGSTRVDVLYLANLGPATELHASRWLDYPTSTREDYRLSSAVLVPTATIPGSTSPITTGYRLTQVAWLGYDAVLDDDEIVVVFDEEAYDATSLFIGAWSGSNGPGFLLPPNTVSSPGFRPATPPPLAPGMTEPLPKPDSKHRHQLKLLRLK